MALIALLILFLAAIVSCGNQESHITTALWLPHSWDDSQIGFLGSVIALNDGKSTIRIEYDDESPHSARVISNATVTVRGTTYYESKLIQTHTLAGTPMAGTVAVTCSRETARTALGVCTLFEDGLIAAMASCGSGKMTVTASYLQENKSMKTWIYTKPADCSTSTDPSSHRVNTLRNRKTDFLSFPLTITAGMEKLSASNVNATTSAMRPSAASLPTETGATVTDVNEATAAHGHTTASATGKSSKGGANTILFAAPVVLPAAAFAALAAVLCML
jgi:hypothetical protein